MTVCPFCTQEMERVYDKEMFIGVEVFYMRCKNTSCGHTYLPASQESKIDMAHKRKLESDLTRYKEMCEKLATTLRKIEMSTAYAGAMTPEISAYLLKKAGINNPFLAREALEEYNKLKEETLAKIMGIDNTKS